MDEEVSPRPLAENLDAALKKYGKIWIWSIFMAIAGSGLLGYLLNGGWMAGNLRNLGGSTSDLGVWAPMVASIVGPITFFLALFWLFQFMLSELLPIFFEIEGKKVASDGAQLLYRAFGCLLIGVGVSAAVQVVVILGRFRS